MTEDMQAVLDELTKFIQVELDLWDRTDMDNTHSLISDIVVMPTDDEGEMRSYLTEIQNRSSNQRTLSRFKTLHHYLAVVYASTINDMRHAVLDSYNRTDDHCDWSSLIDEYPIIGYLPILKKTWDDLLLANKG